MKSLIPLNYNCEVIAAIYLSKLYLDIDIASKKIVRIRLISCIVC